MSALPPPPAPDEARAENKIEFIKEVLTSWKSKDLSDLQAMMLFDAVLSQTVTLADITQAQEKVKQFRIHTPNAVH